VPRVVRSPRPTASIWCGWSIDLETVMAGVFSLAPLFAGRGLG
jgi:hypothetical protein